MRARGPPTPATSGKSPASRCANVGCFKATQRASSSKTSPMAYAKSYAVEFEDNTCSHVCPLLGLGRNGDAKALSFKGHSTHACGGPPCIAVGSACCSLKSGRRMISGLDRRRRERLRLRSPMGRTASSCAAGALCCGAAVQSPTGWIPPWLVCRMDSMTCGHAIKTKYTCLEKRQGAHARYKSSRHHQLHNLTR